MKDNAWGEIIVAVVSVIIIFGIISIVRYIRYRKSEEGRLRRKVNKKKSALTQLSKYGNRKSFVNGDLIDRKKRELHEQIEDDILHYKLNTNAEYVQLKELKKKGVLDNETFNQAVFKIKSKLEIKTNGKLKKIQLENGTNINIQIKLNTFKNDIEEDFYIEKLSSLLSKENNKIHINYFIERFDNQFLIAMKNIDLSIGDMIIENKNIVANEVVKLNSNRSIKIYKNKISHLFWFYTGKTFSLKKIEIHQKNEINYRKNDLVFIDNKKAKDNIYFAFVSPDNYFAIIKTKNGLAT